MLSKLIQFVKKNQQDIILIIGIVLITLISFGAGRLTCQSPNSCQELSIIDRDESSMSEILTTPKIISEMENQKNSIDIQIIGNKNSKIYHYPWCSGAKNMREENKVFFNSKEEAEKAGYRPASNCPGL